MALEDLTGPNKFIANLVPANPPETDPAEQGCDHIQGIKNVLQNSFPGMAGAYQIGAVQGTAINSMTRKDYVDGQIGAKVAKAGDTMTGALTISSGGALSSYRQTINMAGNGSGSGLAINSSTRADEAANAIAITNRTNGLSFRHSIQGATSVQTPLCIGNSTQGATANADAGVAFQVNSSASSNVIARLKNDGTATGVPEFQLYSSATDYSAIQHIAGGTGMVLSTLHSNGGITLKTGGANRLSVNSAGTTTLNGGTVDRVLNMPTTSNAPNFALGRGSTDVLVMGVYGGQNNAYINAPVATATLTLLAGGGTSIECSSSSVKIPSLAGSGSRAVYSSDLGVLTNTSSDAKLKENVKGLSHGLEAVMAMSPVSFDWIDKEKRGFNREIGFIAQEMAEIVPEVIGANLDTTLSLDYAKLVAVMAKAIQELKAEVDALKAR